MHKKFRISTLAASIAFVILALLCVVYIFFPVSADTRVSASATVVSVFPLKNSYKYPANARKPIKITYSRSISDSISKNDIKIGSFYSGSNTDYLPFDLSYSAVINKRQTLIITPQFDIKEGNYIRVIINPHDTTKAEPYQLDFASTTSIAPAIASFKQTVSGLSFNCSGIVQYSLSVTASNGQKYLAANGLTLQGEILELTKPSFIPMITDGFSAGNRGNRYPQEHMISNYDSGVYRASLILRNSAGIATKDITIYHQRPYNQIAYNSDTGELLSVKKMSDYNHKLLSNKSISLLVSSSENGLKPYSTLTDGLGNFRIKINETSTPLTEVRAIGYIGITDLFPGVSINSEFTGIETQVFNSYWP